jgi:hypothetical protein
MHLTRSSRTGVVHVHAADMAVYLSTTSTPSQFTLCHNRSFCLWHSYLQNHLLPGFLFALVALGDSRGGRSSLHAVLSKCTKEPFICNISQPQPILPENHHDICYKSSIIRAMPGLQSNAIHSRPLSPSHSFAQNSHLSTRQTK